jgi:hypothetical protein
MGRLKPQERRVTVRRDGRGHRLGHVCFALPDMAKLYRGHDGIREFWMKWLAAREMIEFRSFWGRGSRGPRRGRNRAAQPRPRERCRGRFPLPPGPRDPRGPGLRRPLGVGILVPDLNRAAHKRAGDNGRQEHLQQVPCQEADAQLCFAAEHKGCHGRRHPQGAECCPKGQTVQSPAAARFGNTSVPQAAVLWWRACERHPVAAAAWPAGLDTGAISARITLPAPTF